VRIIQCRSNSHRLTMLSRTTLDIAEHNDDVAGVIPRTPQKIVLMSADRFGQSILWSKEIDCRRLSIVVSKDRGALLLFRRERVIDVRDLLDHPWPRKFVGVILRQSFTNKTSLSLRNFKRKM